MLGGCVCNQMLFLARWARDFPGKRRPQAFRISWDKVFDAVEYVVTWGAGWNTGLWVRSTPSA